MKITSDTIAGIRAYSLAFGFFWVLLFFDALTGNVANVLNWRSNPHWLDRLSYHFSVIIMQLFVGVNVGIYLAGKAITQDRKDE